MFNLVLKLVQLVIYLSEREATLKSKLSGKLYAVAAKAEVEAREAFDRANEAATFANSVSKLIK